MNATADIQSHTARFAASRHATTYTRADLGINTALVIGTPGAWEARLYYGPEPHEYDSETVRHRSEADSLAIAHSLAL